jgi:enamine deaminase RidA (YjgF/YER057c/UK114 family)
MGRIEGRLAELGIVLPEVPIPHANYLPAKQSGDLVFTAGQPSHGYNGKLGAGLDEEAGRAATRVCALNCIAAIRSVVDLDRVKQVVAVHGLVNSAPDFTGQAVVMNGASDLVVQVFGDAGRHIRTAVGVAGLPMAFAASVYMIVEIDTGATRPA